MPVERAKCHVAVILWKDLSLAPSKELHKRLLLYIELFPKFCAGSWKQQFPPAKRTALIDEFQRKRVKFWPESPQGARAGKESKVTPFQESQARVYPSQPTLQTVPGPPLSGAQKTGTK